MSGMSGMSGMRLAAMVAFFAWLGMLAPVMAQAEAEAADEERPDIWMYFSDEELVSAPARFPKPLRRIAENVTIIHSDEIEAMHAHTVEEVLARVPGLFVPFFGMDFGNYSNFRIQGSNPYHVLFLVDGIRYNNAAAGNAIVNGLPVSIIDRIEVIKGPASSTWGSSLGGVVNIITKDTGFTGPPAGTFAASCGEADSCDINAELAGAAGFFSYYLYGGTQDSDGLRNERYFENDRGYAKFRLDLPGNMTLTMAAGHSDPEFKNLDFVDWTGGWVTENITNRATFATTYFDAPLGERLFLHLALQSLQRTFQNAYYNFPGNNMFSSSLTWEDRSFSAVSRLTWVGEKMTVTMGAETTRSYLDYTVLWIPFGGGQAVTPLDSDERRGIYANATIRLGELTLTPGLRHDYHSKSGEFWSPSFGAVYRLTGDTLLRANIAKGFTAPYLAAFSSGGNQNLGPETIWSYQAGAETVAVPYLRLKLSGFDHTVDDIWTQVVPWSNRGKLHLQGFELEAETVRWHDLSFSTGFSYALRNTTGQENDDMYKATVLLAYENGHACKARLYGRYAWWTDDIVVERPRYGNWLWDLVVSKDFQLTGRFELELFGVVHNLTNDKLTWDIYYENPDRWVEAGMKLQF